MELNDLFKIIMMCYMFFCWVIGTAFSVEFLFRKFERFMMRRKERFDKTELGIFKE